VRLGYFANGLWGHLAFKKLQKNNRAKIVFVCGRYQQKDHQLKLLAETHGIPYYEFSDVNSACSLSIIQGHKPDLLVSMSYDQIFKRSLLKLAHKGIINCHAGALPFYRGRSVLNWVLINDEPYFGITTHFVDEKIDTGDIIYQAKFPITDEDDYASLLCRASIGCAEALARSIDLIIKNKVTRVAQSSLDPHGSYFPKRKEGDELISFRKKGRAIFNFVRALSSPGPGARAFFEGYEVKLEKVLILSKFIDRRYAVGEVTDVEKNSFVVRALDSNIRVLKWHCIKPIFVGGKFL